MGLLIYDALVLAKAASLLTQRKRVLTLGVPTLNFTADAFLNEVRGRADLAVPRLEPFSDHAGFFRNLGFEVVDALDISDYEGANLIGDLNDPGLADRIAGRYDLIYDSGTIEHIFDAPTGLRTLTRLLNVGGVIVHSTPTNGFMDHGLWQLSPDLFRTFYRAAGFSILSSAIFTIDNPRAHRADDNVYRTKGRRFVAENFAEARAVFAARKEADVDAVRVTMQDYYAAMHGAGEQASQGAFFLPFGAAPAPQASVLQRGLSTARWLAGRLRGRMARAVPMRGKT